MNEDKKLSIYHIGDHWFVYLHIEGVPRGDWKHEYDKDHEFIFDTFDEVSRWVEGGPYGELRERWSPERKDDE